MKLKKVNKVLSITLASAMLVSSVPVNTFADEAESELATEQVEKKEEKAEKAEKASVKEESNNPAEEGSKEAKAASAKDAENTNKRDTSGAGDANGGSADNGGTAGAGDINGESADNGGTAGAGDINGGSADNGGTAGSGDVNSGSTDNGGTAGSGDVNGGSADNGGTAGSGDANSGSTNNGNSVEAGNENTGSENNNGKPNEEDKKIEVTYSVTWNYKGAYSYTGKKQIPEAKVIGNGNVEIDKSKYEVRILGGDGTGINVGTYIAEVVITDNDQNTTYKLSDGSSAKQEFTIEKRKVTLEFEKNLTYTGTAQKPEVKFKTVTDEYVTCEVDAEENIDARETPYQAVVSLPEGYKANYTLIEDNKETIEYNIVKADAKVNWGGTAFFYDGNEHVPTPEIKGVNNVDLKGTVTFYKASEDTASIDKSA